MIVADLHIHSKYSKDSLLDVKTLIKTAKRKGLNVIAVTDHNTIKGSIAAMKALTPRDKITLIPGVEMKVRNYDIICLFVTEQPKPTNNYYEFFEEVRELGAITVLAHPFRKIMGPPKLLAEKVNLIETLNARNSHESNLKAEQLAANLNKQGIAGSDAHLAMEIGRAKTIFPDDAEDEERLRKILLKGKRITVGYTSPLVVRLLSTIIEIIKKNIPTPM